MSIKGRVVLVLVLCLLCGTMLVRAQGIVPNAMSYQGRIAIDGQPFDGTGHFKFAIVDGAGRTQWSNDGTSADGSEPASAVQLPVRGGLFSTLLGDAGMQPLTANAVEDPTARLRVWFSPTGDGFQQLAPDRPFSTVPYAHLANVSGWAHDADTVDGLHAADLAPRNHDHWGETWEGDQFALTLRNTGGSPAEVSLAYHGTGVVVDDAATDGLQITEADDDGAQIGIQHLFGGGYSNPQDNAIEIWGAGNPASRTMPTDIGWGDTHDAIGIAGAEDFGVWVGYAGKSGLRVQRALLSGVHVESSAGAGLSVRSAEGDGVNVDTATFSGVAVNTAGSDGLYVRDVGDAPTHVDPADAGWGATANGTRISGASDFGHWVGWAGQDGVHVNRASRDGLHVGSAGRYAVYAGGDVHVDGELTWAPRESVLSLPCSAFEAWKNGVNYVNNGQSLWTKENTSSVVCDLYNAPLVLPQGAVIKSMTAYFYVSTEAGAGAFTAECGSVSLCLERHPVGTGAGMEAVIEVLPAGPAAAGSVVSATSVPSGETVVDYNQYVYNLKLRLPYVEPAEAPGFSQIRFLHVQIVYESTRPY